jgi:hypothetical protein
VYACTVHASVAGISIATCTVRVYWMHYNYGIYIVSMHVNLHDIVHVVIVTVMFINECTHVAR